MADGEVRVPDGLGRGPLDGVGELDVAEEVCKELSDGDREPDGDHHDEEEEDPPAEDVLDPGVPDDAVHGAELRHQVRPVPQDVLVIPGHRLLGPDDDEGGG